MKVFSGERLFQLKATHGVPLDISLNILFEREPSIVVDWQEFIETARKNGWWDFQTIEVIQFGLQDAHTPPDVTNSIINRCKQFILESVPYEY